MNKDYSKYFDKIITILTCLKSGSKDYTQLLEDIKAVLIEIDNNTDELEFNIEKLVLEAEQINLNTDEVEQLLKDIVDLLRDSEYFDYEVSSPIEHCLDDGTSTSILLSREVTVFDVKLKQIVTQVTEFSIDGLVWSTSVPSGTITLGKCAPLSVCKENKTYQIVGNQVITFDPNKIYGYKAGVWNKSNPLSPLTGRVSLDEGAGSVEEYGFGDSFGNGFGDVLLPTTVIIAGLDVNADVRISVIQECGYNPTIA